jgi:hypothetical protein
MIFPKINPQETRNYKNFLFHSVLFTPFLGKLPIQNIFIQPSFSFFHVFSTFSFTYGAHVKIPFPESQAFGGGIFFHISYMRPKACRFHRLS